MCLVASKPSIIGIDISIKMQAYGVSEFERKRSTASWPFFAASNPMLRLVM